MLLSGRQPSSRCRVEDCRPAEPVAVGLRELPGLVLDRLLQPGRCLAGRCAQRDPEVAAGAEPPVLGLLGEQGEQAGDGGGLAGAGTAGEHRGPAPGRLAARRRAARRTPRRGRPAARRRRGSAESTSGASRSRRPTTSCADLHLLAPVAVEVEQRVVEPEHLQPHQRARGNRGLPGLGLGPGQHLLRIGLVLERDVGDGGEVEAGGALAYGADGEGGGEQHLLVGLLGHRPEPRGDVDVGRTQHVGPVESREQAGSPQGQPPVVPVVDHGSTTSPDSRSESSSTIAAGGCHANTPHGWPSTSGVAGPHMPRT